MRIDSIPLFPTMIYKFNIDPKLYDKQNIIDIVEKNYQKSNYRNNFDSNSDLHHSYGDFDNDNYIKPNLDKLLDVYKKTFIEFTKQLKFKSFEYSLDNIVATKGSQYMSPHNHLPVADYSCIHYIKFNKDIHKPTTFRNPSMYAKTLHHLKPKFKPKINNLDFSIFSEKHFVLTTEDDMIIIPSYLEHQVDKSYDDEMRITIVTNLIVND
tara:strand:+ start:472 stop:1101 length:630 start_codon:yes stop_codon:yes gene_type:complete